MNLYILSIFLHLCILVLLNLIDYSKYCHTLRNLRNLLLDWQDLVTSIGGMDNVIATYDDHDFGKDNADSSYMHRSATLQLFKKYFRSDVSEDTDGAYTSKTIRLEKDGRELNVKVIMLDTRYHKTKESHNYLGADQWSWLEAQLNVASKSDEDDIILLVSSIQVIPDDKFLEETWGYEMPSQREKLLNLILNVDKKVILLSGDVHYAEISQAVCSSTPGKRTKNLVEITSSGISHTFTYTLDDTRQLIGGGESGTGGKWVGLMYDTYQSLLPLRYRQHKFKHHYKGLNVGVIDLLASKRDKNVYKVKISILNHKNKVVMEHVEDITKESSSDNSNSSEQISYECIGIRGKLPAWRYALFMSVLVSIFPFFGHFLASLRILLTTLVVVLFIALLVFKTPSNVENLHDGDGNDRDDDSKIKRNGNFGIKGARKRAVLISKDPPKTRIVSPVNAWTEEERVAVYGDDLMDPEEKARVINAMKKMKSNGSDDNLSESIVYSNEHERSVNTPAMRMSTRRNKRREVR